MDTIKVILLAVSAVCLAVGIAGIAFSKSAAAKPEADGKKIKKQKRLFTVLTVFALWLAVGTVISAVSGRKSELKVEFSLFSNRVTLFGFSFAQTTVIMWGIIAAVLVFSVIFRLFVFPRFREDAPKGFQNVLEIFVEAMENFAKSNLKDYSGQLAPYMFSLAVFMIFAAAAELFGLRAPTSDITVTFAMGIITFLLVNICGIKKKGLGGRLSSMAKPTPIIFPIKILSDISEPISLACRLFGNMLGGMIVMDLLKSVLGGYATGIPAVAGLYFNLFHPLIQAYIFIILSMTFINEATE